MRIHAGKVGLVVLLTTAVLLSGCGYVSLQTNSYGDSGSTVTALKKLQSEAIGELNSMEWQLIFNDLPSLIEMAASMGIVLPISETVELPPLTDAQAKAFEDFLKTNNVLTFDDAVQLAVLVAAGQVALPEELLEIWYVLVEQLL